MQNPIKEKEQKIDILITNWSCGGVYGCNWWEENYPITDEIKFFAEGKARFDSYSEFLIRSEIRLSPFSKEDINIFKQRPVETFEGKSDMHFLPSLGVMHINEDFIGVDANLSTKHMSTLIQLLSIKNKDFTLEVTTHEDVLHRRKISEINYGL